MLIYWYDIHTVIQYTDTQRSSTLRCTYGDKGFIADLGSESISAHFQGLQTRVQLAARGWILPHFDVRTISVAWKLKDYQIFFGSKYFSYDPMLSKGVTPVPHCGLPLQHSIWQSVMVMPGASSAARHQQSTKQISAIFLRTMQFSILQAQYELITGQRVGNTSVYFDTNMFHTK